jgi:ABC-2 type transport system permease protein
MAIYRKELQSYFLRPFPYIITGIFWLISGFLFVTILQGSLQTGAAFDFASQMGGGDNSIDVPMIFFQSFLGDLFGSLTLFILPILSMGLYAEEKKQRTLELLATSPLTNWTIAVSKLLGVVTFFMMMIAPFLLYEAIVFSTSTTPVSGFIILLGHLGLILMSAAVLSIGMFISSLTNNSLVAAFLTFLVIVCLWIVEGIGKRIGGDLGNAIGYLSVMKHYGNFVRGVFDLGSFTLFITYILLGIFLTSVAIHNFRNQPQ